MFRPQVVDVSGNTMASQRVVPLTRLRPGYRHLRLHNELDQPLPLSQLFLCCQFLDGDLVDYDDADDLGLEMEDAAAGDVYRETAAPVAASDGDGGVGRLSKRGSSSSLLSRQQTGSPGGGIAGPRAERKTRMSFLVVHDISEQSPYAILKVCALSVKN